MAAAVAMVVSSPHRDDRPKLAPKPSLAKQLAVQQSPEPPPPPLRSPLSRPEFFEQKGRANAAEGGNDKWSDSAHRPCVNETATCKECRNADTAGTVNVILRRGRRAKAPKPLPYLEPIVTYLARSANQSSEGRQKRVTFAAPSSARSLRSRQNRVARANSEKLSRGRRRELAYLVVDLQSGTISSCSDDLYETKRGSLRGGASLQRSLTVADPHTREEEMSTGADGKPVPRPRRMRKVSSPAEIEGATPEPQPRNEESVSPAPPLVSPVRNATPEKEETPPSPQTPSTTGSESSSRSGSIVFQRKMAFEQRESSPRPRSRSSTPGDNKPPPPPRTTSVLTYNVPQTMTKPAASDSQSSSSSPPSLPPKSPSRAVSHTQSSPPSLPPKLPPHADAQSSQPGLSPRAHPRTASDASLSSSCPPSLPSKSPPQAVSDAQSSQPGLPPRAHPRTASDASLSSSCPPSLPPKSPSHTVSDSPLSLSSLPPKSSPQPETPVPRNMPPPPVPAKTELSRLIQRSIRQTKKPPSPPQPYESPDPLELTESLETSDNYSYGATVSSDGSTTAAYEVSDPESNGDYVDPVMSNIDMEEDKPEEIYIDPTQSKQFSSTGVPRPPRPPPPSRSAIKRAQKKKAQSLATSAAVLKNKRLSKQQTISGGQQSASSTSQLRTHKTTPSVSSSHLKPQEDIGEQLYEELDAVNSSIQSSILWRPPSTANTSQSSLVTSRTTPEPVSTMEPAAPSLPPRVQKTSTHTMHRNKGDKKSSPPAEVKRSKSIGDLNATTRKTRQVSPYLSSKEEKSSNNNTQTTASILYRREEKSGNAKESESAEEGSFYEPMETAPTAPRRNKKNVKGALITSPKRAPGNIYNPNSPQTGARTRPAPRRAAPVAPPLQKKKGDQSKSPQNIKKSLDRGKTTEKNGLSEKSGLGKLTSQNSQDEGGVEEYVDMDYRPDKDEKDGPDVYVDMQPPNKISDSQEGNDPSLRPYLRT